MKMTSYRSRWIVVNPGTIVRDAYLVCHDQRIQQVTRKRPDGEIAEHEGLLVPGLVNAHTHLEFSDLQQPLGMPQQGDSGDGMVSCPVDFVSWVGQVMQYRRQRPPETTFDNIRKGLEESIRGGVCAIGEISTFDWSSMIEPASRVVDFRELIGFRKEQTEQIVHLAESHLQTARPQAVEAGLSPHAPYSLNTDALENAVRLSRQKKIPLAMHLAETQPELELLSGHRGPFFDLLNRLDLWTETNFPKQTTPLHFLRRLAEAYRAVVVHGNYLSDAELDFLAANQQRLRLVFCPRTHAYFGHENYPLESIRKKGIELALGTDSRASNPDLSIWREMEFLLNRYPQLEPAAILRMGTIHGARALGMDAELGSLEPGRRASIHFAPPPEDSELSRGIIDNSEIFRS
ncbi:MAG: amidohydrolase family protein [Planctomycetota bacterium]|nr:amidohydrolase family protein [Planctomycetota bacterium]